MRVEPSWMRLVLSKRCPTPENSIAPSSTARTQRKGTGHEPGRGSSPEGDHAGSLILDFPASGMMRNKFLLL